MHPALEQQRIQLLGAHVQLITLGPVNQNLIGCPCHVVGFQHPPQVGDVNLDGVLRRAGRLSIPE